MSLILLAVFGPVFLSAATKVSDYELHIGFAFEAKARGDFTFLPHWFYYVLVIAFSEVLPGAPAYIHGWLAVLVPYEILGLMIFGLLDRHLGGRTMLAGLLTLALLSVTPIYLLVSLDVPLSWTYLLGYVNASPWHSPTQNVLKLWLIPVSLLALRAVNPVPYAGRNERIGYVILSALLVALMTFTKPNYTMCLLPALGLFALYRIMTKDRLDWLLLVFGLGLPAAAVLAFQYVNTFGSGRDASVAFGFLTIMQIWQVPLWQVPVRLLLSVAFPLSVYGLHFERARRDNYLNLSWLVFFFGLLFMYTLYEIGPRQPDGNFIWGAYAALFVLMYASVVFLIREYRLTGRRSLARLPWRLKVAGVIFGLHLIFGIVLWISYTFLYAASR
jgi:hypothetical protein